jgi:hypothetical protein
MEDASMPDEKKKLFSGKVVGGMGIGGVLLAVLGFFGDQTWTEFNSMQEDIRALEQVVSGMEAQIGAHCDVGKRDTSAQWRILNKTDERLTEVYVRIRVLEEIIRYHDGLGAKETEVGMISPPGVALSMAPPAQPVPVVIQKALEEVQGLKTMKRGVDEFKDQAIRQDKQESSEPKSKE